MSQTPNQNKIKKTRNRIPTSCDYCRKRKLKCDRQKPCANCVKSHCEHLCIYAVSQKNSPNNIPKVNMNNEIIKLKLKINKLERILEMNNIDISHYENVLPGVSEDSDDVVSTEDDPMVSLSNKFDAMIIKENKILHSGTTSYVTFLVRDKQLANIFEAYSKRHIMIYESYKQKQKVKASDFPVDLSQNHLSWLTTNAATEVTGCDLETMESIQFGNVVTAPGGVTSMQAKLVLDVINDINNIMPPLFVVNVLVDHFFKYVYPLLPLIDEELFREELSYILVPTENGGCKVAITHLQNASIVSLLLVILRYAYLAVNVKDYGEDNKAIGNEFLIAMIKSGYKIESNVVILAKSLLMALPAEDSVFKKVTLRNVQVLLYLRLYQTYSPEMHEESREHSLTLALIVQMCRSLGANRDPENFPQVFKDPREIKVWRRIFYKLITLDVSNAFEYGCPLIISDDEYDIKLPTLSEQDAKILSDFKKGLSVSKTGDEIKKIVIENAINRDTALEYEAVKLIREGLNLFQNFKTSFKKSRLLRVVDQMQEFVDKRIPSFWEMVQDNATGSHLQLEKLFDVPKVRKFEIRITMQTILMAFYYLLYLNEEDEYNNMRRDSSDTHSTNDGPMTMNSDDVSPTSIESNENFNYMENKYGLKAVELALTILKMNYDYTKYMTQSATLDGNSKQYKAFKYFSTKCDVFILNRIAMSFLRPFLFLSSLFLNSFKASKNMTFEEVVNKFSNSIDSTVVLKWFNLNVALKKQASKTNCEFAFILFQYVKDLFFMNYNLKNEFFISWRNTMMIKLFINYFKSTDDNSCSDFLHPDIVTEDDISTNDAKSDENVSPNFDTNMDDVVGSTNMESSNINGVDFFNDLSNPTETKFVENFLDTAVPGDNRMNYENDGNNMDNLIYDNFDSMLDDMFRDTALQQQLSTDFGLFNVNQATMGIGQIIGNSSVSTSKDRNEFETQLNNAMTQSNKEIAEKRRNSSGTGSNNGIHHNISSNISVLSKNRSSSGVSGINGPFTGLSGLSGTSDNSVRTPDMSMFTDSPVDYNKGVPTSINPTTQKPGTALQDVIDEIQNKGIFY